MIRGVPPRAHAERIAREPVIAWRSLLDLVPPNDGVFPGATRELVKAHLEVVRQRQQHEASLGR